jgi:hypothetical protein
LGVLLESLDDGTYGVRLGVYDLSCAEAPGRHDASPIGHLTVSQGWAVFDDQDVLVSDGLRFFDKYGRGSFDDGSLGIDAVNIVVYSGDGR